MTLTLESTVAKTTSVHWQERRVEWLHIQVPQDVMVLWVEPAKGDMLLANLQDKAVDFIMSKPREVQDDYQALKDALEVRFSKMEHPTSARRQLSYLRQEEGESLEDYADKVLTKVAEAYPGIDDEMEQDLAKEAFLRGCHHCSAA